MKTLLDNSGSVAQAVVSGWEKEAAYSVRGALPEVDQIHLEGAMEHPARACTIEHPIALEAALGVHEAVSRELSSRFFGLGAVLPGALRARRTAHAARYMQQQLNPARRPTVRSPLLLR